MDIHNRIALNSASYLHGLSRLERLALDAEKMNQSLQQYKWCLYIVEQIAENCWASVLKLSEKGLSIRVESIPEDEEQIYFVPQTKYSKKMLKEMIKIEKTNYAGSTEYFFFINR